MGIFSIIGIAIKLISLLPHMVQVLGGIIALLPKFKDGGLWNDLQVIYEILKLIVGLVPSDKERASNLLYELKDHLKNPHLNGGSIGLQELRDKADKIKNSSIPHESDTIKD